MYFKNLSELVNHINITLGSFCNEFGTKRKELAKLGKSPKRGILFTYDTDKGKDWAINEGGGIEVQYHIGFVDNFIRYGLGFNTQYVPFANQMTTIAYMQPFMNSFLEQEAKIRVILPEYSFIYGNVEQLKNPIDNNYVLFGKSQSVVQNSDSYFIEDKIFDEIIQDLKKQFEAYQIIFEHKNTYKKVSMDIQNYLNVLNQKQQVILQGPPGTGKTYTAKDIAEQMILSSVTKDKKTQKELLESTDQFKLIQFHPAYSYEDFVRGIVAENKNNQIEYLTKDKVFAAFAKEACKNWKASKEETQKEAALENWLTDVVEEFKGYLQSELEKSDGKIMITGKAYINRITENSIRYNADVWGVDGGVPVSDIIKMYLSNNQTRQDIAQNKTLTKTAKSLATYWHKVLELFRKYIDDNKLQPTENSLVPEKKYVLIIDEINRANLPSVLGELIYALEYRGEKVESMYAIEDDNSLVIPPNLYIIGTMNTSDRSVGHIDYAIRRRFAFIDILPKIIEGENFELDLFKKVSALFIKNFDEYVADSTIELERSEHLSEEFRPEDVWLGHSYFIKNGSDFALRKKYEIIPILKEYVNDGILRQSAKEIIKNL